MSLLLKILHFFFGHNWSDWEHKSFDEGYYDQEFWKERNCGCGTTQQEED